MKISTAARNAAANALAALADAGSAAAYVVIRSGSPPTNVADADSGTLLATCTMSDPSFGAASAGVITASSIAADSSVDATGTAGHFRLKDSDANTIAQGTVTATGGGGDMTLNTVSLVAAGTFTITSFAITVPLGS